MISKILLGLGVIAAFYIAWAGGRTAYSNTIENQVISPGDIVIAQVSNTGVDWVALHSKLDRDVDLQGFVFTDGDNIFTFPQNSIIPAAGNLRIASSKDEGDIEGDVDQYWGDWGLSADGELVMLVNREGDMVVDFVFAQPLEEGELLERVPAGTGPLMDPRKNQPMQMQPPSYRAIPAESIDGIGQNFSTAVVSFGGLLTTVSTILINLEQTRDILGKLGLSSSRKEREGKS